ncbi:MAG TPA: hypothetical protein VJ947_05925 [Pseudohaliea sp.]|nr:hypothetical protein [Pseudohaliea sp.]
MTARKVRDGVWSGDSGDAKPFYPRANPGDQFYERDTGNTYVYLRTWKLATSSLAFSGLTGSPSDNPALQAAFDRRAFHENGFVERSESVISFTEGTRTASVQPTGTDFVVYSDHTPYVKTGDTVVISDTEGLHFVYYDSSGTLVESTIFVDEIITVWAFVMVVYWDSTNSEAVLVADERHGATMDSQTHIYNHNTLGTRYGNGLALTDIDTGGGGTDAGAQLGVTDGSIWDEDIRHTIVGGSPQALAVPAQIPLVYRSGAAGDWRKLAATDFPIATTGTGRAAWNEDTGATWQLTEVGNNDYVLVHLLALGDINHPIMGIVGQATYATTNAAEAAAPGELQQLNLGSLDLLTPEAVFLGTLLIQTKDTFANAVRSTFIPTAEGDDYIDWRRTVRAR